MLNLALELPQNNITVKTLAPFKMGKMGFCANHHNHTVTSSEVCSNCNNRMIRIIAIVSEGIRAQYISKLVKNKQTHTKNQTFGSGKSNC